MIAFSAYPPIPFLLSRTVIIATHSDLADSIATKRIRLQDGTLTDPTCDG